MTNPNPPTARAGIRPSQAGMAKEAAIVPKDDTGGQSPTAGKPAERGPSLNPEASQSTVTALVTGQGFADGLDVVESLEGIPQELATFLLISVTSTKTLMTSHLSRLEHERAHPRTMNPNKEENLAAQQQTADMIAKADQVITKLTPQAAAQTEEG